MNLYQKSTVGLVLGLSVLVPATTFAAGLTSGQISAIVSLLQSFNADQSAIDGVQGVLSGAPVPPPQHREGEMPRGMMGSSTMPLPPMMGSTTPPMMPPQGGVMAACPVPTRSLGLGAKGDDVKQLQDMLAADPASGFTASSTGVFGPMTMRAMKRFQDANGIASSTTGLVGPATRKVLEGRCGKGHQGGDR